MFPMSLSASLISILFFLPKFLAFALAIVGTILSFRCTWKIVRISVSKKKASLVVYPLFLYYIALAWITIAY